MLSSDPPKVKPCPAMPFAADVFDPRMVRPDREYTSLGLIVQALWMLWMRGEIYPTDDLGPLIRGFEACLRREAPDALADLRRKKHE